jgi:hypothetical protein
MAFAQSVIAAALVCCISAAAMRIGGTASTGQDASCSSRWVTLPSITPESAEWPRVPTTITSDPSSSARSAIRRAALPAAACGIRVAVHPRAGDLSLDAGTDLGLIRAGGEARDAPAGEVLDHVDDVDRGPGVRGERAGELECPAGVRGPVRGAENPGEHGAFRSVVWANGSSVSDVGGRAHPGGPHRGSGLTTEGAGQRGGGASRAGDVPAG